MTEQKHWDRHLDRLTRIAELRSLDLDFAKHLSLHNWLFPFSGSENLGHDWPKMISSPALGNRSSLHCSAATGLKYLRPMSYILYDLENSNCKTWKNNNEKIDLYFAVCPLTFSRTHTSSISTSKKDIDASPNWTRSWYWHPFAKAVLRTPKW